MCNLRAIPHYDARLTVSDALDCFKNGDKLVPIIESGNVMGVLTEISLTEAIVVKQLGMLASAVAGITKEFCILPFDTDLSIVYKILGKYGSILLERVDEESGKKSLYVIGMSEIATIFRNQMKEQLLISY